MERDYCVLVPSEPRGSMGILSVLVKDTRANQSGGREKKEGWGINLLEAWSTHGLHHCFFLVLAFARCAPKISQIHQCNIS